MDSGPETPATSSVVGVAAVLGLRGISMAFSREIGFLSSVWGSGLIAFD